MNDLPGLGELDAQISVVVPVFNAESYLEECLRSIDGQTYAPFEVVCVNDGSTDGSLLMLEEWAAKDERFIIISKENGGPSSARNAGIRKATGDYVLFLDADDLLEPYACQRIAQEIARFSRSEQALQTIDTGIAQEESGEPTASADRDDTLPLDAVVFGWLCFPEGLANDWLLERTNVRDAIYTLFSPALLFDEMTNPYLRLAVRRQFLLEHDIFFDESLWVGEDSAFLFKLFPRTQTVALVSDKLYRYRMPHEGSLMSTTEDGTSEKCVNDLCMMVSIFDDWDRTGLLDAYGPQLMHWFISFVLYTLLRHPEPLRSSFIALAKQLWLAHYTPEELRALEVPRHDQLLIDVVLDAADDGTLDMSQTSLTRTLMAWRIAEYGVGDLAKTAFDRIRP